MIKIYIKNFLLSIVLAGFFGSLEIYAQESTWHSFDEALILADTSGQPILVDVWAPWCGWCHKMKQDVYPELSSYLADHFILTRINRDDHDETYRYKGEKLTSFRLAQKLNTETVPAIIFLNPDGEYLLHLSGFIEAEELRPVLEYISTEAYQHQRFQDFISQKKF